MSAATGNYVSVHNSPGLRVHVLIREHDGSYVGPPPVDVMNSTIADLRPPHDGWQVADINGDRLDDLVNFVGGRVLVLLAGDRDTWTPVLSDVVLPVNAVPTLADVNGDGRVDIVSIGVPDGMIVLSANADGTFTRTTPSPTGDTGSALDDAVGWRSMAVDGSARAGLVHVDASRVTTLMLRDSGWVEVSEPLTGDITAHPGLEAGWVPASVNADAAADLVRINLPPDGQAILQTLLGHGDGHFTDVSDPLTATLTGGSIAGADAASFTPVDLDHDGAIDFVRVFNRGSELTIDSLRSNRDGHWTLASTTPTGTGGTPAAPATYTWRISDSIGDGAIAAVRLDVTGGSLTATGWTSAATAELESSIVNGLGSITQVTYTAAIAGYDTTGDKDPSCRLPSGVAATSVVAGTMTYEAATTSTDRSALTYKCAQWSNSLRILLGFKETTTHHPAVANRLAFDEHIIRQISEASGISQTTTDEVLDQHGQDVRRTDMTYEPLPDAPYRDLLASSDSGDCSDSVCAHNITSLHYDAFGNVTDRTETEAGPTPALAGSLPLAHLVQADIPQTPSSVRAGTGEAEPAGSAGSAGPEPGSKASDVLSLIAVALACSAAGYAALSILGQRQPRQGRQLVVVTVPVLLTLTLLTTPTTTNAAPQRSGAANVSSTVIGLRAAAVAAANSIPPVTRSRRTDITYLHDDSQWLEQFPVLTTVHDLNRGLTQSETLICYDGDTSTNCDAPPPNPRGLPTLVRAWNGTDPTYQTLSSSVYDDSGNIHTFTHPVDGVRNATTTTTYDDLHVHPVMVCNALDQCSRTETWDARADAPTRLTDANNALTVVTYDPLGRLKTSTAPTGELTTHTYLLDATNGTTETTTSTADGTDLTTRTYRDGAGRAYRTETPGGDGSTTSITDTTYTDGSNRPATTTAPRFPGDDPAVESYTYDELGRLTRQDHPDGTAATRSYSVDADGVSVTTSTDETNRSEHASYGGWGELLSVQTASTEGAAAATTRYRYDAADHLTTSIDAHGNTLTTVYNALGQATAEDDPDRGLTTTTYDAAGNVHNVTDALGRSVTYTYDLLGRKTQSTDDRTHITSTWVYDEPDTHGHAIGRLTSVHDASADACPDNASDSLTYDILGNVTADSRCVNGTTGLVTSRYDTRGRLAVLTYPDHEKVGYGYDAAGHVNVVSGYVDNMNYDASGRPRIVKYSNSTIGTWSYDNSRGWINGQRLRRIGDFPLFSATYDHGPSGLIDHQSSSTGTSGPGGTTVDENYEYDALGRLTFLNKNQATWTYDDIGNLTSNSTNGGAYTYPSSCPATPCPGPHAVTAAANHIYSYNSAGDMETVTTDGATTRQLGWTEHGMLATINDTTAGNVTNSYNADDQRVSQTVGTVVTDYFGRLAEWTLTRGWTDYVYAGSELIGKTHGTDRTWYTTDRQGSTRLTTNSRGTITANTQYSPWGTTTATAGATEPLGYTGQRSLGGTALIDLAARAYDPQLGRMISPDSIIPNAANPQALNRYSYAYNNPVTYSDSSGHIPTDCSFQPCTNTNGFHGFVDIGQGTTADPRFAPGKPLSTDGRSDSAGTQDFDWLSIDSYLPAGWTTQPAGQGASAENTGVGGSGNAGASDSSTGGGGIIGDVRLNDQANSTAAKPSNEVPTAASGCSNCKLLNTDDKTDFSANLTPCETAFCRGAAALWALRPAWARLPDYVNINEGVVLPWPTLLVGLGGGANVTLTRSGDVLWGFEVGVGAPGLSGSAQGGWILQSGQPPADRIHDFIHGPGLTFGGYAPALGGAGPAASLSWGNEWKPGMPYHLNDFAAQFGIGAGAGKSLSLMQGWMFDHPFVSKIPVAW